MTSSMTELAARVQGRKQRLQVEQENFDRKRSAYAQHPESISEISEVEPSQQPPKPKKRHHRSSTKSPFDDDSSLQFSNEKKSASTTPTTSSSTPRQPNKFVKKPSSKPVTTEKISVTNSPRDVSSPRVATKKASDKRSQQPVSAGILAQSSLLVRAAHRQQLHAQGLELEPGTFDKQDDDDNSSSDATTTSGSRKLFGPGMKSFLKKSATKVHEQVPNLQHLDSETNDSDRDRKKHKHKRDGRPASMLDTEDDSSLDFIEDGSSSEGRKTPTSTPRKGILKSPKDGMPKETEHSVQFSKDLVTVQTDDEEERPLSPTKGSRSTTPRRVQIGKRHSIANEEEDVINSESDSISTAIDIHDTNDYDEIPFSEHITESPVDNMFANMIMNSEPPAQQVIKNKSPRVTDKRPSSSRKSKSHHKHQTTSDYSYNDNTKIEEIAEDLFVDHYSEDFSLVPTDTSTPRPTKKPTVLVEQQIPRSLRKVTTDDREIQVDLMSAPFQSSLNQVHSIYLINQNDLNETRPSSLIRSVVEPTVLQSLLTTNPVLLAVDDLIREQSSLLRSFVQLQRTYYESTIRTIRPEHVYVTKDNTLQYIAEQQQNRVFFQPNEDSIAN